MDKQSKAGYMLTLEDAMVFWTRCQEAEKALGEPLTQEEREHLLLSLKLGKELSIEDLLDFMKDKKTLIVKDKNNESV